MKEWYFSNDGEISGPLRLAESNKFIASNPNVYAWHPSYAQWVPVSDIEEFDVIGSPPPAPAEIPQQLIEHFTAKERELNAALGRIDNTIQTISASMADIDRDTNRFKQTTKDLNDKVEATLKSVNEQYAALQKTLTGVN
ncbi:DUF4339 domain-containing protein [Shewanella sp. UCD-KL21]|uniref:DUF4339 domain-containing protein n=1 Tax=Shewanella sp. UCD-KL21 TaxID=1917164 RepID=UPI0009708DDD|nr:DUF4339 domain-containing protein [Shewanella sp. UCD-KL21]